MSDLKNKNVVVVGGTSGIGLAISTLAAEAGASVWALGRTEKYIDAARLDTSKQDTGESIQFASVDIHDADALKSLFDRIGQIDHLAGNATGANRTIAPFMEQTAEQFSEAFGKFWGYTNLVRTAVPYISETGSITLTSGTPSRKCRPGQVSLSCVGSAVEALCRALAREIAPIRVNAVAPGIIDTTMYSWMGEKKDQTLGAMTKDLPLARPGKPEDVGAAIVNLMMADYITGTTVDVDGGLLLP